MFIQWQDVTVLSFATVSYLKLWVGDKGLDLFEGFAFAKPEDDLKLKVVLQKFEEYCALRKKGNYGCLGIQ